MADRKLIREALAKRGMLPPDEIDSILAGAGNVPVGYWDDAEVPGASADEAERIKAEIRASQLPDDYWDNAEIAGEPRFEGETDEEYAERTAPLDRSQKLWAASGPSPKFEPSNPEAGGGDSLRALTWPASGPSPEQPTVLASLTPQVQGASHIVEPIVRSVANVVPGGQAALQAAQFVGDKVLPDPPPDAPPKLVSGPSGATAPQMPTPQQVAAGAVPALPGGANIGALNRHAKMIGDVAGQGVDSARGANAAMAEAGEARKGAVDRQAQIQAEAAAQKAAALEQNVQLAMQHQKRLEDLARGEEKAVQEAQRRYQESLEDARYAGISPDKRRELQAILSDKATSTEQKALAKRELDKASSIDPDQYLGSAGKKITAAIAVALGAYGAALTGGPNTAMQIIQQAIQNNLAAQKERFAKREREADSARQGVSDARNQYANQRQQEIDEYARGLEMTKLKIDQILAGTESADALARADALKAQIDEEITKTSFERERQARSDFLGAAVSQGGLMTNAAELAERRRAAAAEAAAAGVGAQAQAANLEARGLALKPGAQLSKEEIKEVSKIKGAADGAIAAMDQLLKLREQAASNPALFASPEFRAKSKSIFKAAQASYKEGKALGTWDKGTQELLDDMFGGDPSQMGFLSERYRGVRDMLVSDRDLKLEGMGVMPLQKRQAQGVPGERVLGQ